MLQASDWRVPRSSGDRLIPGQGTIPLGRLLRGVYWASYRGACAVEIFSQDVPDSLYDTDLRAMVRESRQGLESAWRNPGHRPAAISTASEPPIQSGSAGALSGWRDAHRTRQPEKTVSWVHVHSGRAMGSPTDRFRQAPSAGSDERPLRPPVLLHRLEEQAADVLRAAARDDDQRGLPGGRGQRRGLVRLDRLFFRHGFRRLSAEAMPPRTPRQPSRDSSSWLGWGKGSPNRSPKLRRRLTPRTPLVPLSSPRASRPSTGCSRADAPRFVCNGRGSTGRIYCLCRLAPSHKNPWRESLRARSTGPPEACAFVLNRGARTP